MVPHDTSDAGTSGARSKRPSEEFAAYCELELERRLNSGEPFDEEAYRRGMALVRERLTLLEDGTDR